MMTFYFMQCFIEWCCPTALWWGLGIWIWQIKIGLVGLSVGLVKSSTDCALWLLHQAGCEETRTILGCNKHPLQREFEFLPSSRRYRVPSQKAERFRESFVCTAVRRMNSHNSLCPVHMMWFYLILSYTVWCILCCIVVSVLCGVCCLLCFSIWCIECVLIPGCHQISSRG